MQSALTFELTAKCSVGLSCAKENSSYLTDAIHVRH